MQPLCNLSATTLQPLCNHSATTLQPPCNHPATTMQPLCNHSATTMQPLCNHYATTMQNLFIKNFWSAVFCRRKGSEKGRRRENESPEPKLLRATRFTPEGFQALLLGWSWLKCDLEKIQGCKTLSNTKTTEEIRDGSPSFTIKLVILKMSP